MIKDLSQKIREKKPLLEEWFHSRMRGLPGAEPPIYSSVDLRNAGFKMAVVDTNLFPAGFNNLCETFSENGSHAFRTFLDTWHADVRRILIFPEEHTRNLYYWQNIVALRKILISAELEVEIGSSSTLFPQDPYVVPIEGADPVIIHKVFLENQKLRTSDFVPDLILLNNDLSTGTPDYLKDLQQTILPSPHLGWYRRRKSDHFRHYQRLIEDISKIIEIDPWHLSTLSAVETGIDLTDQICLKRLAEAADRLLMRIRQKYLQYGIRREPYLFIKNDAGTYGLGVTHIDSGASLLAMNRRTRNKLESSKGGRRVSEYLLQEGIPTADFYLGKPLEPIVYLVGGYPIGTFFRIHVEKNEMESLNTPGMSFACLCLHKVEEQDELYTVASFLGRVASLAAVCELAGVHPLLPRVISAS